jgi:hypothetical protein
MSYRQSSCVSWAGLPLFQVSPRHPFTGNQASRLCPLVLRQNSEATHGPVELTRNPHIHPAESCSEPSKRRRQSLNSPAYSCHRFCIADAPEIYQSSGLVVVFEFLTAIQASDVRSSAIQKSVSGQVGWDCFAQCHRGTLMLMATDKNKPKQCPQKERSPQHHTPPRLHTAQRSFRFELVSRCRTIQHDSPFDSLCSGHFFLLRLHLHGSASTPC